MWLLSPLNVASVTEKLNFKFYLILNTLSLNSHMRLVITVLDSRVLEWERYRYDLKNEKDLCWSLCPKELPTLDHLWGKAFCLTHLDICNNNNNVYVIIAANTQLLVHAKYYCKHLIHSTHIIVIIPVLQKSSLRLQRDVLFIYNHRVHIGSMIWMQIYHIGSPAFYLHFNCFLAPMKHIHLLYLFNSPNGE